MSKTQKPSNIPRPSLYVGSAALALAAIPFHGNAPAWTQLALWAAVIARCLIAIYNLRLPPLPVRLLLLGAGVVTVLLSYGSINGVEPGLAVLLVLVALKMLEAWTLRDFEVLMLLGFFLVLCNLFFVQDLGRWLFSGAVLILMVAAAVHAQSGGRITPRQAVGKALTLTLQSLPIVVVLFFLFPRIYGGIRLQFGPSLLNVVGLSERMQPGSVASLAMRQDRAFRATFPDGKMPSQSEMYWRGCVLWHGDGLSWVRGGALTLERRAQQSEGEPIRQQITLDPHGSTWLFALDRPFSAVSGASYEAGGFLRTNRPVITAQRFDIQSRPVNVERTLPSDQHDAALQLPSRVSSRARALAVAFKQNATSDAEIVKAAVEYFATNPFVYSLSPGTYGQDALDEFLFERREGFCEHYAGAFASLMRLAGIPSRVVVGYHGGEFNPNGNYVIVRQSHAHAWCEVWLRNIGWQRIDPTNTIAPERITGGLETFLEGQTAGQQGGEAGRVRGDQWRRFLRETRLVWDNLSYQWDLRVLNFDEEAQRPILAMLGLEGARFMDLVVIAVVACGVVLGAMALLLRGFAARGEASPEMRWYRRFCQKLARAGVPREPWEGPIAYTQRAATAAPLHAEAILQAGLLFAAARYGRSGAGAGEFAAAVKRLRIPGRVVVEKGKLPERASSL